MSFVDVYQTIGQVSAALQASEQQDWQATQFFFRQTQGNTTTEGSSDAKELYGEAAELYRVCVPSPISIKYPVERPLMWNLATQVAAQVEAHKDRVKSRFEQLAARWKSERPLFSSSTEAMTSQPSYAEIIGLGPAVIPFILEQLRREPDYWFAALATLAKTNPVPLESRGDLDKMTEIWLAWGLSKEGV